MNTRTQPLTPAGWLLPIIIAAVTVLLQATDQAAALRLERALVPAEPWRLVTAHLVHLGWAHLGMNLAGLVVIWALLAPVMPIRFWALAMVVCGAGVTLGLWLFSPQVVWYAGFSGILHGLLAVGAVAGFRVMPGVAAALLVLLVFKVTVEQFAGGDAGTARLIGDAVIVDAHLYGAAAGLAFGAMRVLRIRHSPA